MKKQYQKVASYEVQPGEVGRIVLLYSGGLDTSCMLKWLQDEYKAEIITLTLDLGQQVDNVGAIQEKALRLGALKSLVLDVKDEFADEYISKLIRANGRYQGNYYISTISRYLMARKAVEVARQEGAQAIAHGSTGKGNDQVRLDATALTLDPEIKIIAPVREWSMGRDDEMDYARQHGIEVPVSNDFPYSSDDNLWGITWESGEIETPHEIPQADRFLTVKSVREAPEDPEIVELEFDKGCPVAVNGRHDKLAAIIQQLNTIGSLHGVGVDYLIEDRLVGLKVRGVYEHPGAHIIMTAHKKLELYVSTRHQNEFKEIVDSKWGYMCYCGLWLDPLMDGLNAFCADVNERVSGVVKVKLHKGKADVVALESPFALYQHNLASFMSVEGDTFNQNCSAGFIELYGLQMKTAYQVRRQGGNR